MNSSKGNMVLLTIIAVATLLVAVIGATFAYFSATMNGGESTTIEVTSGTLSVEFEDNSKINSVNANPGDVLANKTFTVKGVVTGSTNLNYEADLVIKNNTFSDGALIYTITSTNTSNNGTVIETTSKPVSIPSGANTIKLGKGLFAGPTTDGSTHTYTINVTFAQNGQDQSQDLNKAFEATINVAQPSEK